MLRSLVGSEMCIRDRIESAAPRQANPECESAPSESPEMEAAPMQMNQSPPDAEGLMSMATSSHDVVLAPEMGGDDVLRMGVMPLKKWLTAQGCDPIQVSRCIKHEELLDIAEVHGFIEPRKSINSRGVYTEVTYVKGIDPGCPFDKKDSWRRNIFRTHPSNRMDKPIQGPTEKAFAFNPALRHSAGYSYALDIG
eukprot:TRINITY_DN18937_c0_g1_i1.p1 TRINITY_DN18937_c0_g1~~TRINITY_DN18937_c0_g1_i1.p1  ORF type:complete len:195 (+),score=40.75 TRINITY_DN18937_c0_g1_i1:131-715(+)